MNSSLIGYCRISKTSEGGLSIESQRKQLEDWAAAKGVKLAAVFVDDGFSGKSLERPQLNAALQYLASGKAAGIVVVSISRLSRSVLDVERLLESELKGRQLVVLDMGIDTATPSGRLIVNVMSGIYQFERSNLIARTKAALKVKRQRGEALGRPDRVRYGFKNVDGKLVAVESEQLVIERARQLHQQDRSMGQVASILTREGFKNRSGGTFTSSTVRSMLAA
jgi:site-specific DNA recombinase